MSHQITSLHAAIHSIHPSIHPSTPSHTSYAANLPSRVHTPCLTSLSFQCILDFCCVRTHPQVLHWCAEASRSLTGDAIVRRLTRGLHEKQKVLDVHLVRG